MDPLMLVAEMWWVAPAAVGAGAVGWAGIRYQRAQNARHLEYDTARRELRDARTLSSSARASMKVARAELARTQAERSAGRAGSADVSAARRELQHSESELRAATATVRARRAHLTAARVALPASAGHPEQYPLARLMSAHDAVTTRWLSYETDPAKLIAFPTMTDPRERLTGAFVHAQARAHELRPPTPQTRVSIAEYAAYRDAVHALERAFQEAETEAWRSARAAGTVPPAEPAPSAPLFAGSWGEVAQSIAQSVWAKSAEAFTKAGDPLRARDPRPTKPPEGDAPAGR